MAAHEIGECEVGARRHAVTLGISWRIDRRSAAVITLVDRSVDKQRGIGRQAIFGGEIAGEQQAAAEMFVDHRAAGVARVMIVPVLRAEARGEAQPIETVQPADIGRDAVVADRPLAIERRIGIGAALGLFGQPRADIEGGVAAAFVADRRSQCEIGRALRRVAEILFSIGLPRHLENRVADRRRCIDPRVQARDQIPGRLADSVDIAVVAGLRVDARQQLDRAKFVSAGIVERLIALLYGDEPAAAGKVERLVLKILQDVALLRVGDRGGRDGDRHHYASPDGRHPPDHCAPSIIAPSSTRQ